MSNQIADFMEYERFLPERLSNNVLDIGCGDSPDLLLIRQHFVMLGTLMSSTKFIGIDPIEKPVNYDYFFEKWPKLMDMEKSTWNESFRYKMGVGGEMRDFNISPNSCDVIIAMNSLHFMTCDGQYTPLEITFKKVNDCLTPNGVFYVRIYIEHIQRKNKDGNFCFRRISMNELETDSKSVFGDDGIVTPSTFNGERSAILVVDRRHKLSPTSE